MLQAPSAVDKVYITGMEKHHVDSLNQVYLPPGYVTASIYDWAK